MVWVPSRVCVSDQWWSSHRTASRVWWCSEALISYHYSSVGKESTCHAGDPSSIPGSGRSTGEGIDYPLLYSWVSLVVLLVKNPPAMPETWVWSLGWEDPLEKGKTTHSSILAWRIPWAVYSPWGRKKLDTTERLSLSYLMRFSKKIPKHHYGRGSEEVHLYCNSLSSVMKKYPPHALFKSQPWKYLKCTLY